MAKASREQLEGLHALIAKYYSEEIGGALENGDELSSGTLAAINAFLKNNDITADILESSPMMDMRQRLLDFVEHRKEEVG